jgi:N-acetylglutamate synthase-like GNAT family acetyltransferase
MISLLIQPEIAYAPSIIQKGYKFVCLEENSSSFQVVKEIFENMIEPVYGDISATLEKIKQCKDRRCEFMVSEENGQYIGLIIYKKTPTNEFAKLGIRNSLEIKTLLVIDPKRNSGKGLGTALLKRVEAVATQLHASSMHVTVSELRPDALEFFKKKQFKICSVWKDKYQKGVSEYLLSKPLKQKPAIRVAFQLVVLVILVAMSNLIITMIR